MHAVAKSLREIATEVGEKFLERSVAIEAIMLTILTRQHAILLGPPGTGKSALVREVVGRITDSEYFETLLSRTRPDQAVLGPYDIPLLRDQGEHKRKMKGYLPTAHFAFLDEIGKMSPTLGHELLAVLNERIIHEVDGGSGKSWKGVPLSSAFGASNEHPMHQSDEGAALWDRLLVRINVNYIREPGNRVKLWQRRDAGTHTTVSLAELQAAIEHDVPAVTVSSEIAELVLVQLGAKLENEGITVTDRRWETCMRFLQAAAFFNGRSEVEEDDIRVLKHVLWDMPEQVQTVERAVLSIANPLTQEALKLLDEVEGIRSGLHDRKGESSEKIGKYGIESSGKLRLLQNEAEKLKDKYADKNTAKVDEVLQQIEALRQELLAAALH